MGCNGHTACAPAFVFCLLSFAALLTGILVEEWYNDGTYRYGLFRSCVNNFCQWHGFMDSAGSSYYFFLTQTTLVASGCFALLATCLGMIPSASGALQLVSSACGTAGLTIFTIDYFYQNNPQIYYLGWAYWLTASAIFVLFINGLVLTIVGCCSGLCCKITFGPCQPNQVYPV